MGEHFFTNNKLSEAIRAYTAASKSDKPRIYSFALYKLAWCDYNAGEYLGALEKFRNVIAYSKKTQGAKGEGAISETGRIQLVEESLSDMVRTYSHLDALEEAVEFYNAEVGRDKAYSYLHKLAKLYNKEGKYTMEVKTYQHLNGEFPYREQAPENQTSIMNAYAKLDRNDMVRKEVRRLIDLYSPNGPSIL